MSRMYSLRQATILIVTMIVFATLTLVMTTRPASAQAVTTIAQARAYLRGRTFFIDTIGCTWGASGYNLDLSILPDNVTLVGKYYRDKSLPSEGFDVRGSINIVPGTPSENGTACKVSFNVNAMRVGGNYLGVRIENLSVAGLHFEGAIRFNRLVNTQEAPAFMAGTFTIIIAKDHQTGPFPFSAQGN